MLHFAIQYCVAIDVMTADRYNDLCKYELVPTEWAIATELRDVLNVRNSSPSFVFGLLTLFHQGFQTCDIIFFS